MGARKKPLSREIIKTKYTVYKKKAVWIEALCIALIWLLFFAGLGVVFYLRESGTLEIAMNSIIAGILFLSFMPFVTNWDYYSAIWKAWKTGKEIIYKESTNEPFSILGNKEVWIKN